MSDNYCKRCDAELYPLSRTEMKFISSIGEYLEVETPVRPQCPNCGYIREREVGSGTYGRMKKPSPQKIAAREAEIRRKAPWLFTIFGQEE